LSKTTVDRLGENQSPKLDKLELDNRKAKIMLGFLVRLKLSRKRSKFK